MDCRRETRIPSGIILLVAEAEGTAEAPTVQLVNYAREYCGGSREPRGVIGCWPQFAQIGMAYLRTGYTVERNPGHVRRRVAKAASVSERCRCAGTRRPSMRCPAPIMHDGCKTVKTGLPVREDCFAKIRSALTIRHRVGKTYEIQPDLEGRGERTISMKMKPD